MKIYTKTGDKGQTSLISGTRVDKYNLRLNAYGTVDELNAFIGLLKDNLTDESDTDFFYEIQCDLFTIGSNLACDKPVTDLKLPEIKDEKIIKFEQAIDKMNENIEPLNGFILPGGHPYISYAHIARTVCRRAERLVVELASQNNTNELIIKYLNRLSDFLFVFARKLAKDLNINEIKWKSK